MKDFLRDTIFGHIVRLATGGKFFKYPEEEDAQLWKRYVHAEKSAHMARHGQTQPLAGDGAGGEHRPQPPQDRPSLSDRRHSSSSGTVLGSQDSNGLPRRSLDPEKGRDVYIVDWYGNDDPENPRNWSRAKRFFVTFEICLLTFSIYIGSAIYSAGILDVSAEFGVSHVASTLGLCLFVAGYGVGPMFLSPLSEVPQIGRNPVYILTLALFVVLQVPTALATNFGMLLAFRFITGFIGSPALATGGATIGDMYRPSKRTYGLAVWGVGAICGPALGPLVGGFAAEKKGWTWTIWELMWLSGFTLVLLFFFLPETSSTNILFRRTRRLRKLTGNDKLICEAELAVQDMTLKDVAVMTLVRPFQLTFVEPIVFALNMYIALIYGLLYIWFESFPIVFVEIYGFTLGTSGLAFLGLLIGAFVVLGPFCWYQHRYIEPKFDSRGELKPEWRLPPAFVGAFCIPICLFWFGWSSRSDIHWIMPIIGTAWFSIGAFLLFNAVLNYLSDAYPQYVASVLAGNDFFRSSFGAGFPLFARAMYKDLGVDWASSTLAFISVAFIPIPFFLFKYGEQIRHKMLYSLFVYAPNKWAPIFFTVLYAMSGGCHIWQCYRYKAFKLIGLHPLCGIMFTVGYALRVYGSRHYLYDPDSSTPLLVFIMSQVFVYCCPPLLELANYHVLGRVFYYVPYCAPFPPGKVLATFGGIMGLVELLNALGVSLSANPSSSHTTQTLGGYLSIVAISLQLVVILVFTYLAGAFHRRCLRASVLARNVKSLLFTLYGSMFLIFIRCLYRLVEHAGNTKVDVDSLEALRKLSPILRYEVFFYVFEATLMFINSALWNVWHPGRLLPKDYHVYLGRDGIEVVGEEDPDERPLLAKTAHVLSFGILYRRKRKGSNHHELGEYSNINS